MIVNFGHCTVHNRQIQVLSKTMFAICQCHRGQSMQVTDEKFE